MQYNKDIFKRFLIEGKDFLRFFLRLLGFHHLLVLLAQVILLVLLLVLLHDHLILFAPLALLVVVVLLLLLVLLLVLVALHLHLGMRQRFIGSYMLIFFLQERFKIQPIFYYYQHSFEILIDFELFLDNHVSQLDQRFLKPIIRY